MSTEQELTDAAGVIDRYVAKWAAHQPNLAKTNVDEFPFTPTQRALVDMLLKRAILDPIVDLKEQMELRLGAPVAVRPGPKRRKGR